ncbi:MAG: hypothetical protein HF314_16140 [Ignavibacteria bacterium]|nr:hypothetical protein [Ignavibacteria bacterium]MCU7504612.1 hypothetical protein [Ignavibacteria bacterium]MCU7517972.1 hypothetical protein [Ignavibacteria bacterium]
MEPTVTTGDWFLTLFITAIPLIGLIMLFVWAFGGGANENKSNWAKAMLLWILIGIVLSAVVVGVFFAKYYRRFAAGF